MDDADAFTTHFFLRQMDQTLRLPPANRLTGESSAQGNRPPRESARYGTELKITAYKSADYKVRFRPTTKPAFGRLQSPPSAHYSRPEANSLVGRRPTLYSAKGQSDKPSFFFNSDSLCNAFNRVTISFGTDLLDLWTNIEDASFIINAQEGSVLLCPALSCSVLLCLVRTTFAFHLLSLSIFCFKWCYNCA